MKVKINVKSIIFMTAIALTSLLFMNISFATNTGKVTTETARLREKPNTDSKVLELITDGTEIVILEEENDWYKINYKNTVGYVRKDLIEKIGTTAETNQVATETATAPAEENKEEVISELGKRILVSTEKLRIIPLVSSIQLGEVAQGTEVEVTEVLNHWAKIKTADGKEGWIVNKKTTEAGTSVALAVVDAKSNETETPKTNTETATEPAAKPVEKKTMYVNSQIVNVRKEANTTSEVVKKLDLNTSVSVISIENGWACIELDGKNAYISASLLSNQKQETSRSATVERNTAAATTEAAKTTETQNPVVKTEEPNVATGSTALTGSQVVAYAQQFIGCKYKYGGTTTSGFDCSGFTQYVYKHFGISLNRTAADQYRNGVYVTDLQAGDLVMFGKSGIYHVGIYVGGGTFVHAANTSRGVTTDTLTSGYYKTNYAGARRVI